MTLISVIYGNQYPVIVTDRAITDKFVTDIVLNPVTGRYTLEPTNVVDFRVKSVIIKDILCLAFAGNEHKILRVCDEIIDYFLHREINKSNLEKFLNYFEFDSEISILIALGGPEFEYNKIIVACVGEWSKDNSKDNLDIYAAGTGADEWIRHFVDYQGYLSPSGDKLTDCLHRALVAAVRYIGRELYTEENFLRKWGGGFDLIYYADNRFQRYDNITYAFWYAREENPDILELIAVNHNCYEKGNVISYAIDGFKEPSLEFSIIPQFRNAETLSKDNVVMACKSDEIITLIFVRKLNGTTDTVAVPIKEWDKDTSPMFVAIDRAKGFRYAFRPDYKIIIKEALKEFLD